MHEVPLRLLAAGKVTGLRIDHPDGLYSPTRYFRELQRSFVLARVRPRVEAHLSADEMAAQVETALDALPLQERPWPVYVLAEKILGEDEELPRDWAIDGTTGYDFLNAVNGLFVAGENAGRMEQIYTDFVGERVEFTPLVKACKKMIMQVAMASEINSLSHQLDRLAERNRNYRDFTLSNLRLALRELIACLPVYRTYTDPGGAVSPRDRTFIEMATEEAKRQNPRTAEAVFDFVRDTLLLRNLEQFPERDRPRLVEWVLRFQQVTGPIMAKGIEDTAFYVYNRLVSLNEVGGHPHQFGITAEAFHEQNLRRAHFWPYSMLASSTHDTKRSEDVRARLNVLAELPDEWGRCVAEWRRLHDPLVRTVDGEPAPSRNDQYLFYQTLVGAWPEGEVSGEALASVRQRLTDYLLKAAKEAKQHTSWINPNERYDEALREFVSGVLSCQTGTEFQRSFAPLQRKVAYFGRLNALAQTLFKLTSPGVPDIYQGNELWDLSLVDPDNRRPVDYGLRRRLQADVGGLIERYRGAPRRVLEELLARPADGRVKLYVTMRTLKLRQERRDTFLGGRYVAVPAAGEKAPLVCAYARGEGPGTVIVAGCVRPVRAACGSERLPVGALWGDTGLFVPAGVSGTLRELFSGEPVAVGERDGQAWVPLADAFAVAPFAVLVGEG
jgi:(1->4)-alpha-D-glucan 1-alpha-D-glucosylmutase